MSLLLVKCRRRHHLGGRSIALTRQPSHSTRPEGRVSVCVPPRVHRPLDQSSSSSKNRVEITEGPPNVVAFRFVSLPVPGVLLGRHACSLVYAVVGLELSVKGIYIHRLDVTSHAVGRLDPVLGILKRDPVDPCLVTAHQHRRAGRDWTRAGPGSLCDRRCRASSG